MCDPWEELKDAVSSTWDAISDAVEYAWDEIVTPALEEVFGWFGIEDETVVIVNKTSVMLFANNTEDVIKAANVKAVLDMTLKGGSFFPWYMKHTRVTKSQIKAFYKYAADEKYIHGLPELTVKGSNNDISAADYGLAMEKGVQATRISSVSKFPTDEVYFQDQIQSYPYYYIPWANTLNAYDPHGIPRSDWELGVLTYNAGPDTWDYSYSRVAENAIFWIEGPVHIVEGDSATYTITCNRTIPVDSAVQINLSYGGTASGSDYTEVASATMTSGNNTVQFIVDTNEDIIIQGSRTIIITMDSLSMDGAAFEEVTIGVLNAVTTIITDDEGLILTMPSVLVTEASGTVDVPVKLETAAAGAFTVDYGFTDGTALGGGVDYDSTPGVLNFAGTAGEVQNITVPITTPDGDDDKEYFTVNLTACDDPLVDITQTATVTITDGTDDPVPGTTVVNGSIPFAGYTSESSMVFTFYYDYETANEWYYWVYRYSDGTYPNIVPELSTITDLDMMPVGIIRHDKIFIDANKETEEYKTTKRLIDNLGIDIDDIIANVAENEYIGNVTDCFINFAACPNSTGEMVSKMLYLQFNEVVVVNSISSNNAKYSMSFEEQNIQNSIVWTEHSHTTDVSGIVPNGQEYSHEIVLVENLLGETTSDLYIRHKTSLTTYDEINIKNLNNLASVKYAGYSDMVLNKLGDDNFTVPLSHAILIRLDPLEMMVLYQDIVRLDMYSQQIIEIAWYQTDGFLTLFQFAMIVITIVTVGIASGPLAVLQQLLLNYLIVELVIFLAELTGSAELAAIVGIVAMIWLGDASGIASFDFASAEGLLNLSTQFADNLTVAYDTEMQGLQEDMRELNEKTEQRLEEIKEAREEGGLNDTIDIDFASMLQSVDTMSYPAQKAQYNFDLIYNYDTLITQYHDNHLQKGVI